MFKCLSPAPLGISAASNDLIEPALSYGFKGLELDVVNFSEQVKRLGLPTARRLIDSAKLRLGFFALPFEIEAPADEYKAGLESLKAWGATAAELGCTRCTTTLAPANDERPLHQNFVFHQQRVNEIAAVLAAHDIQLGIGFTATPELRTDRVFEFIRNFDAFKMLMSMFGAKNVGMAVDLYELWVCGASIDSVKASGLRPIVAFVADAAEGLSPNDATQAGRRLPGETNAIDSAAALSWLAETGYDGPIVPRPSPDYLKSLGRNAIFKLAGEKLDAVWKAAGLSPAGKLATVKR